METGDNQFERFLKEWKKTAIPQESEEFVSRVMADIRRLEEEPVAENHGLWWKIPAFSLAAFCIAWFGPEPSSEPLSTDTLLLSSAPNQPEEWVDVISPEEDV